MKVGNKHFQTIWMEGSSVWMIDQNLLPFEFVIYESVSCVDTCEAIRIMKVRGAGAIGAAAAFAMAQAFIEGNQHRQITQLQQQKLMIEATRPTARDLFFSVQQVWDASFLYLPDFMGASQAAVIQAEAIAQANVAAAKAIGIYGNSLLKDGSRILTHCNAGWLAFVDYGSALSPIYVAHEEGKKVFVYADETRPRAQGARLTAWELQQAGTRIP